jgi:hypothetical protein
MVGPTTVVTVPTEVAGVTVTREIIREIPASTTTSTTTTRPAPSTTTTTTRPCTARAIGVCIP